jgi:ubiquitin-activating enzyme E1
MIGAGALGCEYVKMLALMGLGANGKGVIVTDDDNIEVSNLNR